VSIVNAHPLRADQKEGSRLCISTARSLASAELVRRSKPPFSQANLRDPSNGCETIKGGDNARQMVNNYLTLAPAGVRQCMATAGRRPRLTPMSPLAGADARIHASGGRALRFENAIS
jgi:hypothetical protein